MYANYNLRYISNSNSLLIGFGTIYTYEVLNKKILFLLMPVTLYC